MYCIRCGAQLQGGHQFCFSCGTPVRGAATMMPASGRIAGHIRLLGILWIAISAFRLIPGLILVSLFHEGFEFMPPGVPPFVHGLLQGIGTALIIGAVLGLAAGAGLLQRQPWARLLAIIMAFLNLMDMPLGTALGVYTLWVLLPAKSEEEYRQMTESAASVAAR